MTDWLPLSGILLVIVGFGLRLNPLLVVSAAGLVTGLASGLPLEQVVAAFGKAFVDNRFVAIAWTVLPVVGLLERAGLKERARMAIAALRGATAGRLLLTYFAIRQIASALGLTSLGGHVQMVRPLIAPMTESAAELHAKGSLSEKTRARVRANAAAADNIGLFFGEDVFIAIGSILLMKGFLEQNGIRIEPLHFAMWAIPTAVLALLIHGARLLWLDRQLAKENVASSAVETTS
jgi:uncharacterized membrane protein